MSQQSIRTLLSITVFWLLSSNSTFAQTDTCYDFTIVNGNLEIPISIQGKEFSAFLTTSNIGTSIPEQLADELNLDIRTDPRKRTISNFGRRKMYRYVRNVDMTIFNNTIRAREMAVLESSQNKISVSLRVFEELIVQLNFPESQVCFYPQDSINLRDSSNIDFSYDQQYGTPAVRVRLNNSVDTWLRLSTDSAVGLTISPSIASRLGLYDDESDRELEGSDNTLQTTIEEIAFGPYTLGNIRVKFPKPDTRDNLSNRARRSTGSNIRNGQSTDGFIDLDVLHHFTVTIDFKSSFMHVIAQ